MPAGRASNKTLRALLSAARRGSRRIVLCEGEDPRIIAGAVRAARDGVAQIILLGRPEIIVPLVAAEADEDGSGLPLAIIDPADLPDRERYACAFQMARAHKGPVSFAAAMEEITRPVAFAAMMVREGDADGTVGGATHTTADTVRAALQLIGPAPGQRLVSSFFLMVLARAHHLRKGAFIFADCGLVVEPDALQLAEIALASAQSWRTLIGSEPKVAMISFSTHGSASHPSITRVCEALRLVRAAAPELAIDGEMQFDAAFVAAVGAAKAPDSPLQGEANIFIFPNLEAGNIGYKIAERIGGALAIGPILQGLARPANDLSRGCTAEDVYYMIAVTAVQAAAQ